MKNIIFSICSAAAAVVMMTACSEVTIPEAVTSEKVSNLSGSTEGRTVTLTWTLPSAADQSGVNIYRNNDLMSSLDVVDYYVAKRQPANQDLIYTVKMVYGDGRISEGESFATRLEGSKVAMLVASENDDELDDDELAAKNWFKTTYGTDCDVFTPATLPTLRPQDYTALWIQIDRVGIGSGVKNLPAAIIASNVIDNLTNYVKEGGNVLLTKHATQLITAIGRIDSKYAPNLFGDGEGGEGTDIWTTNAVIASGCDPSYDHRSHSAFAGLEVLPVNDGIDNYDHESYPLEGPGWREDHNCMWDLNAYGLSGQNVVVAFEAVTNSTVLSTWGHVTDYCCAGIVEFLPTDDYLGRVLCIGLSAYEFNQKTGNQYQQNTEKLTKNCIDYLAAESDF